MSITELVAKVTNIPESEIRGRSRKQEVAQARAIRSALALRLTDKSKSAIAREYGLHHTTVLHHEQRIRFEEIHYPEVGEILRKAHKEYYDTVRH